MPCHSLAAQQSRIGLSMQEMRQESWVQSLSLEDPLEKEMATHSNVLAWEVPRTEEPAELKSMGLPKSLT